jgi:hypothetical protein
MTGAYYVSFPSYSLASTPLSPAYLTFFSLSSPPSILVPSRQNCFNLWNFVAGHQDVLYNNTCAIWQNGVAGAHPQDADMIMTQNDAGQCSTGDRSAVPILRDNSYYTTHGNASVNCGGEFGTTVADMQKQFPDWDERSTWHTLPDAVTVIQWGRDVLGM